MDEVERDPQLCGGLGARGKFRRLLEDLAVESADFDGNRAIRCFRDGVMAFQFEPLHRMTTDAEGGGLTQDDP